MQRYREIFKNLTNTELLKKRGVKLEILCVCLQQPCLHMIDENMLLSLQVGVCKRAGRKKERVLKRVGRSVGRPFTKPTRNDSNQ